MKTWMWIFLSIMGLFLIGKSAEEWFLNNYAKQEVAIAVQTGKISIQNFEETIQRIYQEADYVIKVQKIVFKKSLADESEMIPDESKSGFGAGIIFRRNGAYYVLSASHLASDDPLPKFFAHFRNKEKQSLEVVASNSDLDFAVLAFNDKKFHPEKVARFGNSSALKPGTLVLAFGFWATEDLDFMMRNGIVVKPVGPPNFFLKSRLLINQITVPKKIITHSAQIAPGFSGGPLVLLNGEVAGVNVILTPVTSIASPINEILEAMEKNDEKYRQSKKISEPITVTASKVFKNQKK